MNSIILKFLEKQDKTNLHALLCLKSIYNDDNRDMGVPFLLSEMSGKWRVARTINPSFLDSDYAPVFFSKQPFITKIEKNYYINENFRDGFRQIDWENLIQKIGQIKPMFSGLYQSLLDERERFIDKIISLLAGNVTKENTDNKLVPALLEIFSYSILKIKLNFYGADIYRWTKTNANDGGVDMTCGDVSYCVTTKLNLSKINKDAQKQVRDKLNFITIRHTLKPGQIQEIAEKYHLTINIVTIADLIQIHSNFSLTQKELLLHRIQTEIEKELE